MIRKMNKQYKEKGITLAALVVTVIILLILAGVTLNIALSENGIFSKAKKATKEYQIASEREYLEQNVLSVQLDKYMGNVSSEKLGKELNTRNLNNTSNWHIIKVNEKSYEMGWNYVEKGTELEGYGNAKNSWLINYETGEVIELEEDNYISLSAGDMLAVKDSLIINVDSSIIDENIKNDEISLEKQLGENIDLVDFNYNENSGLTNKSFKFDGEDDYIKISYNDQKKKEEFINQGFTFEFYGNATLGNKYKYENGEKTEYVGNSNPGGFCWCNGEDSSHSIFHFNFARTNSNKLSVSWSSGGIPYKNIPIGTKIDSNETKYWQVGKEVLDGKLQDLGWNNYANNIPINSNSDEPFYLTITFNPKIVGKYDSHDICEQKLYLNGKLIDTGYYYYDDWDDLRNHLDELNYFYICKSSMNGDGIWGFMKMDCYALRLYSRVLSEEEVNKNYEKSVEYHSLLEK